MVEKLLEEINSFNDLNETIIQKQIKALVQIQVVFKLDLLEGLKQKALNLMEKQFLELNDQVDSRISVI